MPHLKLSLLIYDILQKFPMPTATFLVLPLISEFVLSQQISNYNTLATIYDTNYDILLPLNILSNSYEL